MTGGELFGRTPLDTVDHLLGGLTLSEEERQSWYFELGGIVCQAQRKISQRTRSEMQYRDCL